MAKSALLFPTPSRIGRLVLVTLLSAQFATSVWGKEVPEAHRCSIKALSVDNGTSFERIVPVEAGTRIGEGDGLSSILPAHCLIRGVIDKRTGVGGRVYGIGFELRLPKIWNGRFLFQGGAGLDGVISPAVGKVANSRKPYALAQGFAVVSTDGGHSGSIIDASFGFDQQARIDYSYNAVGQVTRLAKMLIAQYYARPPRYSYFVGCSNGGRQAMMTAQRLPLEFDGIVAGDPSIGFSRLALGEVWNLKVLGRISPRDVEGRPIISRAFSDDDLGLVRGAVLKRCDALDGLSDGMINDWRACAFKPSELQCLKGHGDACLSPGQVSVLQDVFSGPRARDGSSLYGPFNYDTGVASSAWRGMRLGTSPTAHSNAADAWLGLGQFRQLQLTPPDPQWDPYSDYDLDDLVARIRFQGALGDADSPFISTFTQHGKMIIYNGLSDQGISTPVLARWYDRMLAASGSGASSAVRLFAVPGMLHCGGGEATDNFEMLDEIVGWVEGDRPPDRINATGRFFPGISRPLCPYPLVARYEGGDVGSADSFACQR